MILLGLKINMQALDEVFDREFEGKQKVTHEKLRRVHEHDIIATRRFQGCNCESLGLRPGMTVDQLVRLGAGCCDNRIHPGKGWVCGRLVALRRLYGH